MSQFALNHRRAINRFTHISLLSVQFVCLDAQRGRTGEENRLRPDRRSYRPSRKRTAAGAQNARLEALGVADSLRSAGAMAVAASPDQVHHQVKHHTLRMRNEITGDE